MSVLKKYIYILALVVAVVALLLFLSYRASVKTLGVSVGIENVEYAREESPAREYIVLKVNPRRNELINLSAIYLESAGTTKFNLPKGAALPLQGMLNETKDILVGEKSLVVVSTGKSPIGVSFRENKCTGYLGQFQNYYPELTRECPLPAETVSLHGVGLLSDCRAYVESLPTCETRLYDFPEEVEDSCQAIVRSYVHYNACVEAHSEEPDFYLPVWRIYLNKKSEIWRSGETIKLTNESGEILDVETID